MKKKRGIGKREIYIIVIVVVVCDMWTNMEKWWVFVVSGGTPRGVQQQQGNASRAFTAGTYLVPISPLVNDYFN